MRERGITRLTRRKFAALFREAISTYADDQGRVLVGVAEAFAWDAREEGYRRGYNAGRRPRVGVPRETAVGPRVATHGLRGLP